jgi:hypothetical protein
MFCAEMICSLEVPDTGVPGLPDVTVRMRSRAMKFVSPRWKSYVL